MDEPCVPYDEIDGEVSAEDFKACLPHAKALVREMIWPNEPYTVRECRAWRRAVLAAIRADVANGGDHGIGTAGGFSIGSFSVSGASGAGSATAGAMRDAARRELVGTGLLYMGMGDL